MRYVDKHPGPGYTYVGGETLQILSNLPPEATKLTLKFPDNKDVTDAWERRLRNVSDAAVKRRMAELGNNAEVVYTADVTKGVATLAFYVGPRAA